MFSQNILNRKKYNTYLYLIAFIGDIFDTMYDGNNVINKQISNDPRFNKRK